MQDTRLVPGADESPEGRFRDTVAASGPDPRVSAIRDLTDQQALRQFTIMQQPETQERLSRFNELGHNPSLYSPQVLNKKSFVLSMARKGLGLTDPLDSVDSDMQKVRGTILAGRESSLTIEAAQKALDKMGANKEAYIQDAIRAGKFGASDIINYYNSQKTILPQEGEKAGVVEDEAADYATSSSVATSSVATQRAKEAPDYIDRFSDRISRVLQIEKLSEKYKDRLSDQSIVTTVLEGASAIVPLSEAWRLHGLVPGSEGFLPSRNLESMRNILMDSSREDFQKLLTDLETKLDTNGMFHGSNELLALQFLSHMAYGKESESQWVNMGLGLDVATLPLFSAVKAARSSVAFFRESGATTRAAETLAEQSKAAMNDAPFSGLTDADTAAHDLYEELLPFSTDNLRVSAETRKILKEQEYVAERALTGPEAARLTPEEEAKSVEAAKEELAARASEMIDNGAYVDWRITKNPINDVNTVSIILGGGKGRNQGYASASSAKRSAIRYGYDEGTFDVIEEANLFYIKKDITASEKGFVSPFPEGKDGLPDPSEMLKKTPSSVWRTIFSPNTFVSELLEGERKLSVNQQQLFSAAFKSIVKPISKLSTKQRTDLDVVVLKGMQSDGGTIYQPRDLKAVYKLLHGRPPNEKEVLAYYSFQNANNMVWMMRNSRVHADLARNGFEKYSMVSSSGLELTGNGRKATPSDAAKHYVYDADHNTVIKPGERNFAELEGKILIESQFELEAFNNLPVKYIMANEGTAKLGPLDWQQVNFRPGGSVDYGGTGKFFLKQTRVGKFEDGTTYLREPRTHHVFNTKREGELWAKNYNDSLLALKGFKEGSIGEPLAREVVESNTPYSLEEFAKLADDGTIDINQPFELTANRGTPPAHLKQAAQAKYAIPFDEESSLDNFYRTNRLAFTKRRGDRLLNPDGTKAQILSPTEALRDGITNAINMKTFYNITHTKMEKWVDSYLPYLEDAKGDKTMLFKHGVWRSDAPAAIKSSGEAIRQPMLQLLNTDTATTEHWRQLMDHLADKIAGYKVPSMDKVERGLRKAAEVRPVELLRRAAFHSAFLGDISQIFIQPMTAVIVSGVDPRYGANAWRTAIPLRKALQYESNPAMIKHISQNWKELHGMEPKEFEEMFEVLSRSGVTSIGGTLTMLDSADDAMKLNGFLNKASKAAEILETPFFESEKLNRIIGGVMAFRRLKDENPAIDFASASGATQFAKMADDYAMNMTRASNAFWQKGLFTIPTQFSSYMARYIESMLPQSLGGTSTFSGLQKSELLLSQLVLHGGAGGFDISRNWIQNRMNDAGITDPLLITLAQEGIIDSLIEIVTGGQITTSGRLAVLGGPNLIAKLLDPEASAIEVLGGPAIDVAHRAFTGLNEAIKMTYYVRGEQAQPINRASQNALAELTRSMSRATKGYIAFTQGEYYSGRSGKLLMQGLSPMEAAAISVGFQPRELVHMYERMDMLEDAKNHTEEIASMVAKNVMSVTNEKGEATQLRAVSNIMRPIKEHHPDVWADVLFKVHQKISSPSNKKVWERYIKEFGTQSTLGQRHKESK